MFQVRISKRVHFTVFSTKLTILAIAILGIQTCSCTGSLASTPSAVDGVLTSCGETRLTCSHDNVAAQNTRWRISSMDSSLLCQETVDHTNPTTPYAICEFQVSDITDLTAADGYLNSTAMVSPLPLYLNGSQMECIAGPLSSSPSVGSITLCVVGEYCL